MGTANAQSVPSAARLSVSIVGEVSSEQNVRVYRYRLSNDQGSQQAAAQFVIAKANDADSEVIGTPVGWLYNNNVGDLGIIGWTALAETLVRPGQTVTGFELRSEGLPSIVDAFVVGFIPFDELPKFAHGEAPDSLPGTTVLENSLKLRVLGPGLPPQDFDPVTFLLRIIELKSEASTLGWIDQSGISNSLQAKLNAALESLKRGQTESARNQLQACLRELEAQKGKHLTADAVGLLGANLIYMLDRM